MKGGVRYRGRRKKVRREVKKTVVLAKPNKEDAVDRIVDGGN